MKTVLITNDDGFYSNGLQHLKAYLSPTYNIYIVAPDRERSGISMSLTINYPLRLHKVNNKEYMIDGTPADCVNIALQKILPQPPDFIISGMNLGENLSEDVLFSGTVAGAFVGCLYGIPSLAVSLVAAKPSDLNEENFNLVEGAKITKQVLEKLLTLKNNVAVYNLNIPLKNTGNIVATGLGFKNYQPSIVERTDPRGKKYYWIGTGNPSSNGNPGTDLNAIHKGNISLSILKYDLNSEEELKKISTLFNET
jgi:5'-nucleotidase